MTIYGAKNRRGALVARSNLSIHTSFDSFMGMAKQKKVHGCCSSTLGSVHNTEKAVVLKLQNQTATDTPQPPFPLCHPLWPHPHVATLLLHAHLHLQVLSASRLAIAAAYLERGMP